MKFNDLIFNEAQTQEFDPINNEYFMDQIYPKIQEKEDDDPLVVYFIPFNSLLYVGLIKYFGSHQKMLDTMRSAVEDNDGIYFATGIGYDIWSSDVFNAPADGQAKQAFLDFLNKDH